MFNISKLCYQAVLELEYKLGRQFRCVYTGDQHFVQVVNNWRKCRHYSKGSPQTLRLSDELATVF